MSRLPSPRATIMLLIVNWSVKLLGDSSFHKGQTSGGPVHTVRLPVARVYPDLTAPLMVVPGVCTGGPGMPLRVSCLWPSLA